MPGIFAANIGYPGKNLRCLPPGAETAYEEPPRLDWRNCNPLMHFVQYCALGLNDWTQASRGLKLQVGDSLKESAFSFLVIDWVV